MQERQGSCRSEGRPDELCMRLRSDRQPAAGSQPSAAANQPAWRQGRAELTVSLLPKPR